MDFNISPLGMKLYWDFVKNYYGKIPSNFTVLENKIYKTHYFSKPLTKLLYTNKSIKINMETLTEKVKIIEDKIEKLKKD